MRNLKIENHDAVHYDHFYEEDQEDKEDQDNDSKESIVRALIMMRMSVTIKVEWWKVS